MPVDPFSLYCWRSNLMPDERTGKEAWFVLSLLATVCGVTPPNLIEDEHLRSLQGPRRANRA